MLARGVLLKSIWDGILAPLEFFPWPCQLFDAFLSYPFCFTLLSFPIKPKVPLSPQRAESLKNFALSLKATATSVGHTPAHLAQRKDSGRHPKLTTRRLPYGENFNLADVTAKAQKICRLLMNSEYSNRWHSAKQWGSAEQEADIAAKTLWEQNRYGKQQSKHVNLSSLTT